MRATKVLLATRSALNPGLKKDSQTLTLPDGRTLAFAEYGVPQGYPVLFFHGWPSSRLEGYGADKLARRNNLRLLSPDRPGFGLSSPQPNRTILDYASDVQALAKHANISRFAIIGGSGGGPYAVACAYALPRDTLSGVGILGGAGAWDAGTQHIPMNRRIAAKLAKYWPWSLRAILGSTVGLLRWMVTTDWMKRRIEAWLVSLSAKRKEDKAKGAASQAPDTPALDENDGARIADKSIEGEKSESREAEAEEPDSSPAEQRERLVQIAFEAFAQGAGASVQDAALITQHWGFQLEDVNYPIKIWHGTKDANAPIDWVRSMARRMPNAELKEYEGETHYTLANHLDEILREIVPEEERRNTRA